MTDTNSDAPNVKIVPPLVYLAGLAVGFLANVWMPIKFIPDPLAWALGGIPHCLRRDPSRLRVVEIKRGPHDSATRSTS